MSQFAAIDIEALAKQINQIGVSVELEKLQALVALKQLAIEALKDAAAESAKCLDKINDDMRAFSSIAYELEPDARVAYLVKRFGSTTAAAEKVEQMLVEAARVARWVLVTKWAEVLMIIGPAR